MKHLLYFFFIISSSAYCQYELEAIIIDVSNQSYHTIVDIDNFGTSYYILNNILYKKNDTHTINYSNVQLGELSSANAFNPLKINLFYKDFNTAIILDNRLAEIFKVDFNTISPYKNVSHISTGNDNSIWIFNQDTRQLELYDYKTNKVRATTLPVQSDILDMVSNYNFCWLLTENFLYKYNYFGSLTQKIKNEGYMAIDEDNGNLILQKENRLFYLKKGEDLSSKINTPELLINQFLVTNETLYIYHLQILTKFQLKNK